MTQQARQEPSRRGSRLMAKDVVRIMSRFPELRRIEQAIEKKDERELRWALAYCESRLSSSTLRQHQKHWQALISRVQAALDVVSDGG